MMRLLIMRRLPSHSANNFSSPKTIDAIRAPYAGGLLISLRWRIASCDEIRSMVSCACVPGEVRVALAGDSNIAENLIVVNPGRVGKVDGLGGRAGIES